MEVQTELVEAMLNPITYPEETGPINLIQTHISFVFLTKEYAYKVKKAVNFGFLDFSTLEKRCFYCEKELKLNQRLCPDLYLEVVPINKSNRIMINGAGKTIDYALKMKRLPQERIMTFLLGENKIDKKIIDQVAAIVADFHSKTQVNSEISTFGSLKIIKLNWDENFAQTKKYIQQTISQNDFDYIQDKINRFVDVNKTLFEQRITYNHIRDCHGDLHSGNIFVTDKICVFDAIEFNDRFRYSDVASDVAFLAMDLDYRKRPDLSEYFISRYLTYSEDQQLKQLLSFYKCYRAYVRGKVVSFRLDDPNIPSKDKESATQEAQAYFMLATQYAKKL